MKNPSKYVVALTAALGLFMAVLDNTVVNVTLTPMSTALKASLTSIEWVVTGYFLAQAAVIPVSGYLSNRVGIKRLFMVCVGLFTTGSLLCGLAQNETQLIAFRVVQGIGGGALFPLAQAIAFGAFPPAERAAASGIVGIPVLLAPAFGPTIGGLLNDNFGWASIFFVNVPVGIFAIFLAWRVMPADAPAAARPGRFDYLGLGLSMAGVLAIVYAFTLVSQAQPGTETVFNPRGTPYGWGYWPVWALVAGGVVTLAVFAFYELRISRDPVLDLRIYQRYEFLVGSLITWVVAAVIFGSLLLIPIFLEQVRLPHLSALDTGLAMMPQGLASAAAVALGSRLYNRVGVRSLILVGSTLLVISSWGLTQLTPTADGLSLLPWLVIRGLGFGFTFIPVQTLAMQPIVGAALAKASSLFAVTRQIFSSAGVAVVITLFVQQTTQHATDLRAQLLAKLPAGVSLSPTSPAALALRDQLGAQAGTAGANDVFTLVTIGTLLIVLLAVLLPRRTPQDAAATPAGEPARPPVLAE
ncbi:MAG TPA: MDR family MFS transporter [Chloroflexia bacterium]|nr:MDR family MFS transporter [Chloroflexia bacterium]